MSDIIMPLLEEHFEYINKIIPEPSYNSVRFWDETVLYLIKLHSHVSLQFLKIQIRSGMTSKLEKLWRTVQYFPDSFLFLLLT